MKFKKEELNFLNLFSTYTDNSINGDKLRISVKQDKIYFYQSSISTKIVYETKNLHNDSEREYVLLTSQFLSLIKLCKKDSTVEIKDDFIIFDDGAKYQINDYESEDINIQELLSNAENKESRVVKDLKKIDNIKSFVGKDTGYNNVVIMDNHFVSYNDSVLAFTESVNKVKEDKLTSNVLPVLSSFVLEELEIFNIDDEFDYVKVDGFHFFFEKVDNQIPFIFDDDVKQSYTHTNKVSINTDDLKYRLKRINVSSKMNIDNKIVFKFCENKIILKTVESPIAEETLSAEVDKELYDFYAIVYCSDILSIVDNIKNEFIEIQITPDINEVSTIVFKDVENKSTYISRLSEYMEDSE